MEQFHPRPVEPANNEDSHEEQRVKQWMLAIDDARETGSGENVPELIKAMHDNCNPDVIQSLGEERRRGVQSHQTDPEQ